MAVAVDPAADTYTLDMMHPDSELLKRSRSVPEGPEELEPRLVPEPEQPEEAVAIHHSVRIFLLPSEVTEVTQVAPS